MTTNSGHYLAIMHIDAPIALTIGALGDHALAAGDYVYIGSAQRGLRARVARHRRLEKRHRWHVDVLRARARWVEARLLRGATGRECALAAQIAALPGATRPVPGFGASDCGCPGHLIRLPSPCPALPGELDPAEGLAAEFLTRDNRFTVRARLTGDQPDAGAEIRAYLPNTARLAELLTPSRPILLTPTADPKRKTRYTMTRIRDAGEWVALAASKAEDLLADWLMARHPLPELPPVGAFEREVRLGRHRLDFRLRHEDGTGTWLEVKSLSGASKGDAFLSRTPSTRAAAHLELLGDLAESGERAALAFIVQRRARRLRFDEGADPGWLTALRRARTRGVITVAFQTRVTPAGGWIEAAIPVVDPET